MGWPMTFSTLHLPASKSSPHGYSRASWSPRAARSHSFSVGSRFPAQRAQASASYQEMATTGALNTPKSASRNREGSATFPSSFHFHPSSDQYFRSRQPPASTNLLYCPFVRGNRSIKNASVGTLL